MPRRAEELAHFDGLLRQEVDHVLEDHVFQRSPTQSRLLKYLCEETIAGRGKPSQFSVAVDGLGRNDDYDLSSDSYPRVQVSRLRRTLANVYARIEPLNGLCLFIRHGEYRLYLAPREAAYPVQRMRQSDLRTPADAAPAIDEPPPPGGTPPGKTRKFALSGAAAAAAALLLAALAFIVFERPQRDTAPVAVAEGVPLVHVEMEINPALAHDAQLVELGARTRRLATNHIAASFVVGLAPPDTGRDDTAYRLLMDLDPEVPDAAEAAGAAGAVLNLTLIDRRGATIYRATTAYDGNLQRYSKELDSDFSALLAPNGIIAHNQFATVPAGRQSDYDCFIAIEVQRARSEDTLRRIDQCQARFPNSSFAAYWLARKSFILYQQGLTRGIPVAANGEARKFYHQAFAIDDHNAYTNALAAKIAVAGNDCDNALIFFARAMNSGRDAPALIAMLTVDILPCPMPAGRRNHIIRRLERIAYRRNEPDPLLHPYLALAALELGDREMLGKILQDSTTQSGQAALRGPAEAILKSAADPTHRAANNAEFERVMRIMAWNGAAQKPIMRALARL